MALKQKTLKMPLARFHPRMGARTRVPPPTLVLLYAAHSGESGPISPIGVRTMLARNLRVSSMDNLAPLIPESSAAARISDISAFTLTFPDNRDPAPSAFFLDT